MQESHISKPLAVFLAVQVVFFIVASLVLQVSMFFGFLAGLAVSVSILYRKGFTFLELYGAAHKSVVECRVIFIIILLMGAMISVWLASGTIPYIIQMGMGFIEGKNVVLMGFVITGTVALTMGTALGAFSTIGIALLAIGKACGVPMPLMMGAILSGAFISDKMAPVAGLVNLTLNLCEVSYREYVRKALKTLIPVVLLSGVVFGILGSPYILKEVTSDVLAIQTKLLTNYSLSPLLLILPVSIILLALWGVTTTKTMAFSLGLGSVFGVFMQGMTFKELAVTIVYGYHPAFDPELAEILSGGGVFPMLEVILIILTVLSISYIFEYTGVTGVLTAGLVANLDSARKLYFRTGLLSLIMTSVSCDQGMGIIMPAKVFKTHFDAFGKERATLAQIIADTGILIAPLEFWNVNALIITALTGVHAWTYGPYTVLCYLSPAAWLAMSAFAKASKETEERTAKHG